MEKTNLASYNNHPYHPGGTAVKRLLWYYTNLFCFQSGLVPVSGILVLLLRLFGAKVGKGAMIKPSVNIKYPWLLQLGDNVWIGEKVWIDNLVQVRIGDNACLSQGALVLTGSHNYKKTSFDLITGEITIEEGAWICADAVITSGTKVGAHAVLTASSVANADLEPYSIYQGNPAVKIRDRIIS